MVARTPREQGSRRTDAPAPYGAPASRRLAVRLHPARPSGRRHASMRALQKGGPTIRHAVAARKAMLGMLGRIARWRARGAFGGAVTDGVVRSEGSGAADGTLTSAPLLRRLGLPAAGRVPDGTGVCRLGALLARRAAPLPPLNNLLLLTSICNSFSTSVPLTLSSCVRTCRSVLGTWRSAPPPSLPRPYPVPTPSLPRPYPVHPGLPDPSEIRANDPDRRSNHVMNQHRPSTKKFCPTEVIR